MFDRLILSDDECETPSGSRSALPKGKKKSTHGQKQPGSKKSQPNRHKGGGSFIGAANKMHIHRYQKGKKEHLKIGK